MNLLLFPVPFVGIFCLSVGIFVFIKNKDVIENRLFFVFSITLFVWLFSYGLMYTTRKSIIAFTFGTLGSMAVPFIPSTFYHFIVVFLNKRKLKKFINIIYGLSFVFALSMTKHIAHIRAGFPWGYYTIAGPFYLLFLLFFIAIYLLCVFLLFFSLRDKDISGIERMRRKFVFVAFATPIITFIDFLPQLGVYIYPLGYIFVFIWLSLLAYAILKYRLMDIRVFISKAVAFLISYPLFLGVPFIFAYRMQWVLYPILYERWWLVPAGLIVFFATIAPLAYAQIRSRMENTLLVEQKRYQKLLLQAASGMVTEHNLDRLAKLIVYIVKRAVKINFAAIFIDDKKDGVYRLKAIRDSRGNLFKNITFLYEYPLIKYLKNYREPSRCEELPPDIQKSLSSFSEVNLIIPSSVQDNLLGFVFLGEKLNEQPYSEEDINVFKILSHQAALAIENCLFMEESKQTQERIFAAEKLASIGGIADGVAHQIKNRLNQFSVASGELKYEIKDFAIKHSEIIFQNSDLKETFDYLVQIADSIINNVKRTDGVIKGILNFARVEEKETFFSHFLLKEVVDLSIELLRVKHEITQVPLEIKFDTTATVYGVKSQITEVVYNILDNAFEAIQEKKAHLPESERSKFVPLIKLKLIESLNADRIEVSDNGIGIRKDDERKIFAPFFTTKSSYKSGTGIGMYVVKRMIEENHKGKVWFSSEYTKGTTLYVELPKK